MTDQAFVVLPKPGSVRRRVDNPFAGSEEVAPLPPKRRENTYQYDAMQAWFSGEPDLWVVQDTVSGKWYRMWNDEHRRGRCEAVA
ncbi:hypothetical protein PROPHIT463_25 [Mycobacterium phage prophiT46-3]|nr:hypothetical protein PROPHIT463_25 [Mycobacterium phage prophiT46-3]